MKLSSSDNHARTSTVISRAAARTLHHASRFATQIGGEQARRKYPGSNVSAPVALNMFVTINWRLTESGLDNFAALRNERFCRWMRTRCGQLGINVAPHYIYSREQGHVHWQVHVPEKLIEEFIDLVPRWVTSLEQRGSDMRKRAQNHEPAPKGVVDVQRAVSSVALRKYLLKGIDPKQAYRFGIRKVSAEGLVAGKRTGNSRSLGRGARATAGYKPKDAYWARDKGSVVYSRSRHEGAQLCSWNAQLRTCSRAKVRNCAAALHNCACSRSRKALISVACRKLVPPVDAS